MMGQETIPFSGYKKHPRLLFQEKRLHFSLLYGRDRVRILGKEYLLNDGRRKMKFPSGGDRFGVSSVLTYFCLLPQRTLVGLVRDLRGIAFAFNAKTSFMMLFEWMYPNSS